VGVTRQTIISIEKGKFVPSVSYGSGTGSGVGSLSEEIFWLDNSQEVHGEWMTRYISRAIISVAFGACLH
jgi:DNA-binding XRE family transcriptional regulator